MLSSVEYLKFDDEGFHITVNGKPTVLEVDNIVVCAGQESRNNLSQKLDEHNIKCHVIGGALNAVALDAKRAIKEASYLAAEI